MYTLEGVSSVAIFISVYEESYKNRDSHGLILSVLFASKSIFLVFITYVYVRYVAIQTCPFSQIRILTAQTTLHPQLSNEDFVCFNIFCGIHWFLMRARLCWSVSLLLLYHIREHFACCALLCCWRRKRLNNGYEDQILMCCNCRIIRSKWISSRISYSKISYLRTHVYTVEPQWLEHLLDHGNSFETWVLRATEG